MLRLSLASLAALLISALALGDDWVSIGSFEGREYFVDPTTLQTGQRPDTKAPSLGIWVRNSSGITFQEWVECGARWSAKYYTTSAPPKWEAWAPIPPETADWAVWKYLCHAKGKKPSG